MKKTEETDYFFEHFIHIKSVFETLSTPKSGG